MTDIHDFTDDELAAEITRRNRTGWHRFTREQGWVHEGHNSETGEVTYTPAVVTR